MSKNSAAPLRVLAVDDDASALLVTSSILREQGCTVLVARSGKEGIEIGARERPDVILLDANMPGMDGFATAQAMTDAEGTNGIPIIMVTSLTGPTNRLLALQVGAVDLLSKPVEPDELRAKVQSLGRLKAYNDEMKRRQGELRTTLAGSEELLRTTLESYSRFVPQEFLRAMGKNRILEVKLGDNVKVDFTILFSDIRAFTQLSEKMKPEECFAFLNSYLRRMNPFIWENGGYIDKYIGDAIMALFPSSAVSAITSAVAMLSHLPVYNVHRASFGYAPVEVGIGIHKGPVMLGVIGHERFMQGTVISDSVNLASRLQGLTKTYGVSLVVSSAALFDLKDPNAFNFRFLDKVKVRGKEEAVSVYEVFDADAPELRELKKTTKEEFEKGVYDFHAGRIAEALARFESIGGTARGDPPVEIYRLRCARAIKLGTTEEFDSGSVPGAPK
jgi:class 3 adenylate cyclase/ActR/RegA family two-component response regulator